MSRIRGAVVLGMVLALTGFASFALASNNTVEVNGGYVKSTDDFAGNGEKLGGGMSFGAAYWVNPSPTISWGGEVGYDNLGSLKYDNGFTTNNEARSHALRFCPAMRVNFSKGPGVNFFGQLGAGLYEVTGKVNDSVFGPVQSTDSKFGFNGGVGMSFPVSPKARMVVNGAYHNVSMSPQNLNYWQFRGGVGFSL